MIRLDDQAAAKTNSQPSEDMPAPHSPVYSPGKDHSVTKRKPPASEATEAVEVQFFDARSLVRSAVAGLSDKATRGIIADETMAYLREKCPGWDLYALHAEFESWVNADPARTPVNWQKAFIGWVKRHHEKHKHELRR